MVFEPWNGIQIPVQFLNLCMVLESLYGASTVSLLYPIRDLEKIIFNKLLLKILLN